ncbi:hypothetical protein [Clostridium tepidiprofundi]|uniref:hypothetical protein n=1 Tax=Clostridium tepidiprofundi TaxID=420412 RepID=UPI0008326B23|nr:hypothetical protein [Clostridium tepidiprofundi]
MNCNNNYYNDNCGCGCCVKVLYECGCHCVNVSGRLVCDDGESIKVCDSCNRLTVIPKCKVCSMTFFPSCSCSCRG